MNLFDELQWRGLVYDSTPEIRDRLAAEKVTAYVGFDPTAASLHVGSLLPIMALARLQRFGHTPIAVVGGGTGLIGDPSGKTLERQLLTVEQVEANIVGIREQLSRFLDFDAASNAAIIVNNHDWLGPVTLIEFLRDVGKHFTVNYMLAKESVKRRVASEDGISYTEFSYMLLQSYDYLVLHDRYDCTLQLGGSDQWGNIVAGAELIRRMKGAKAGALVMPLVTNAAGTKFGKTESGTVWLDPHLTSPYRFYQFWLNTDDQDVGAYLRYFTWLEEAEIAGLEGEIRTDPGRREAQRRLASEVTAMVHGVAERDRAIKAAGVLFGGDLADLSADDLLDIFEEVPGSEVPPTLFGADGVPVLDLVADHTSLVSSRREARRLLEGGGLSINDRVIEDQLHQVRLGDAIEGRLLVLRKGKKNYHIVRIK
jgi:tyrosyl-tRNA synthetase